MTFMPHDKPIDHRKSRRQLVEFPGCRRVGAKATIHGVRRLARGRFHWFRHQRLAINLR